MKYFLLYFLLRSIWRWLSVQKKELWAFRHFSRNSDDFKKYSICVNGGIHFCSASWFFDKIVTFYTHFDQIAIITARKRSLREGYVFTFSVCSQGGRGRVPIPQCITRPRTPPPPRTPLPHTLPPPRTPPHPTLYPTPPRTPPHPHTLLPPLPCTLYPVPLPHPIPSPRPVPTPTPPPCTPNCPNYFFFFEIFFFRIFFFFFWKRQGARAVCLLWSRRRTVLFIKKFKIPPREHYTPQKWIHPLSLSKLSMFLPIIII